MNKKEPSLELIVYKLDELTTNFDKFKENLPCSTRGKQIQFNSWISKGVVGVLALLVAFIIKNIDKISIIQ